MTEEGANVVFNAWKEYVEIADKFRRLMLTPPASFLPYPFEVIEEALNIVAKQHFDAGDRDAAATIQKTMAAYLGGYFNARTGRVYTDEESLENMQRTLNLILSDKSLKEAVIGNLDKCRESWLKVRQQLI